MTRSDAAATSQCSQPAGAPVLADWIWLFPLAYGAHIAEELWWGGGFPLWITELSGRELTVDRFVQFNAAFFVIMLVSLVLARWWRGELIVILGTIVGINAMLHLGGSAVSGSYSPGAVTGVVAWLPLAFVSVRWGRRHLGRSAFLGVLIVGAAAHVGIVLLALAGAPVR